VKFEIQGRTDNLNLIVSSEPALTESEILSYITTGRSPVRSQTNSQKSGNDAMNLAADFGLSQVTGGLQSSVQEKTGFDVLQVRYDPVLGATLVAGRYLDPRLYATFEQPLQYRKSSATTGQRPYATSVGLEYELERWLLVNLHAESSLLRAMLRARHEY
jgi:autotransporter translocation and assembly factor TamB